MRAVLLILGCLLLTTMARAQAPTPSVDPAVAAALVTADSDLRRIGSGIHTRSISDAEIRSRMAAIPATQASLAEVLATLTPRLQDIDARLAQLGPPPGASQPAEPAQTTAERKNLARVRETVDASIRQARLLTVEAGQTNKALNEQLRANFQARLWTRSGSILDPTLFVNLGQAAPAEATKLADVVTDQVRRAAGAVRRPAGALTLALGVFAAIFLIGPARWLLNRLGVARLAAGEGGSRLRRSTLALWLTLVAALTPLLAGAALRAALSAAGILTDEFDELLGLVTRVAALTGLLEGLGRALLSADRPSWRLPPLPDDLAARLAPFPGVIAGAAGLALLISRLDSAYGNGLATSVAGERITVLLEIVAIGATLLALTRPARRPAEHHGGHEAAAGQKSRLPWVLAALAAWLALAGAAIAVLAGYLALGGFLVRETIWMAMVLAMLFVTITFVDDVYPAVLGERAPLGRLARQVIGFQERTVEHIAVLLSGVCRLVLLLLGWAAIITPFDTTTEGIISRLTSTQAMIRFGDVAISPAAVLGAVGLFVAGMAITRAVRGWLEVRYLPKTDMDIGVRASLVALFSYIGAAIAVLVAVTYLGLKFSQFVLFASALSVGIGFGLQSIIGNFVSGLILLVERPVKVGDWIAIGDMEGDVKAINIRATEIDMWDKSKLIVPNSELVSKTVRNVTHSGAPGRVRIVLCLDPSVDPNAVRDLVMARLAAHPDILADPAPGVFFTDIHDGALEFTIIAWASSPRRVFAVKSQLLFQIVPDLRGHGMDLARSNTVVTLGLPEPQQPPELKPVRRK